MPRTTRKQQRCFVSMLPATDGAGRGHQGERREWCRRRRPTTCGELQKASRGATVPPLCGGLCSARAATGCLYHKQERLHVVRTALHSAGLRNGPAGAGSRWRWWWTGVERAATGGYYDTSGRGVCEVWFAEANARQLVRMCDACASQGTKAWERRGFSKRRGRQCDGQGSGISSVNTSDMRHIHTYCKNQLYGMYVVCERHCASGPYIRTTPHAPAD